MGKGKRKRGRSTDNGSGGGVLRSVAWALELVGGGRPWDHTSQVSADGVQSVGFECLVVLDDQVTAEKKREDKVPLTSLGESNANCNLRGISLESLCKRAVSSRLGGKVLLGQKIVTKGILGGGSTTATSSTRGEEEGNVWDSEGSNSDGGGSNDDEVHQESTFIVNVQFLRGSHVAGCHCSTAHRGRCEGASRGEKEGEGNRQKLHGDIRVGADCERCVLTTQLMCCCTAWREEICLNSSVKCP